MTNYPTDIVYVPFDDAWKAAHLARNHSSRVYGTTKTGSVDDSVEPIGTVHPPLP